jgi:hypothetical protein
MVMHVKNEDETELVINNGIDLMGFTGEGSVQLEKKVAQLIDGMLKTAAFISLMIGE